MPRILVVDDEEAIAELIGVYLRNEGFDVEMFGDGAQAAIRALDPHAAPIDLAILDVMLPGLDGLELCRRIRAEHAYPIIMLTAKGEQADRVAGLTFGADDYVVKPFLPLELVARVKAQLRRATIYNPAEAGDAAAGSPASGPSLLVRGGLVLDISAHEATLNERPLPLTPTEFSILQLLLEANGAVLSARELYAGSLARDITTRDRALSPYTFDIYVRRWVIHLRNRTTSKPSGDAGTKLNAESLRDRLTSLALGLAAAVLGLTLIRILFGALFDFIDTYMNGAFMSWSASQVLKTFNLDELGLMPLDVLSPDGVRFMFYQLGLGALATLVIAVALTMLIARRMERRRTLEAVCRRIDTFMEGEAPAADVFGSGFDDVALRMTEIKRTMRDREQALRDEASRKNDLITYLAHDLKTPLASVVGYLSLLDEVPDMPAEQRNRYTATALDKARRLERLINEFFDITRYNLQNIELEMEPVDLSFLLVQMLDEFYPLLNGHGNTAKLVVDGTEITDEEPEPLMIEGDAMRLARVFNNILKNAIAYSSPNTPIAVNVDTADAERVRVRITDMGLTVPPHKLQSIFDKFYRVDETRATSTGGAGLGLAIAREIVHLHGGEITAQSSGGTTGFTVELPRHNA